MNEFFEEKESFGTERRRSRSGLTFTPFHFRQLSARQTTSAFCDQLNVFPRKRVHKFLRKCRILAKSSVCTVT